MILTNVTLIEYSLDEKNSRKEEKPTRLDPGSPRELAIDIKKISVEMKVSEIKKLKVGMSIEFKIDQDVEFTVPNFKIKEDEDISEYINGIGRAEIGEIEDIALINSYDEDETEEVILILSNGYAEGL